MNAKQQQTLWIGATRYYLGRATYAVSDFCELLIAEWNNLDDETKSFIKRDIEAEIKIYECNMRQSKLFRVGLSDREYWDRVCKLWDDDK